MADSRKIFEEGLQRAHEVTHHLPDVKNIIREHFIQSGLSMTCCDEHWEQYLVRLSEEYLETGLQQLVQKYNKMVKISEQATLTIKELPSYMLLALKTYLSMKGNNNNDYVKIGNILFAYFQSL